RLLSDMTCWFLSEWVTEIHAQSAHLPLFSCILSPAFSVASPTFLPASFADSLASWAPSSTAAPAFCAGPGSFAGLFVLQPNASALQTARSLKDCMARAHCSRRASYQSSLLLQ